MRVASLLGLLLCTGLFAIACGRTDLDLGPPSDMPVTTGAAGTTGNAGTGTVGTGAAGTTSAGARVALRDLIDLSADVVDLHLFDHWPRTVRLTRPEDRDVELSLGVPDRVLVVWTERGRDFVCVEPWTARANALNDGSATLVAPGGTHETTFGIGVV